jgi:Leucine-rich repeat (LRR) protein
MNLRIKLRKNQSLVPTEKLVPEIGSLEILGDNIERLPSLEHLNNCKSLSLQCPELNELPLLPKNLVILKIKTGRFKKANLPQSIEILKLSSLNLENLDSIHEWPRNLKNVDFSHNRLSELPTGLLQLNLINRLSLDSNLFKVIPEGVYQFKRLNHLSVDNNPIEEEEKIKLHQKLGIWF